jgi:hypothetical protein
MSTSGHITKASQKQIRIQKFVFTFQVLGFSSVQLSKQILFFVSKTNILFVFDSVTNNSFSNEFNFISNAFPFLTHLMVDINNFLIIFMT